MANAQISTSLTIVSSLLGFQAISLTEFATSAQSLIAAGSKIEIGGAYFTFSGNETPNASSWTAIGTGNVAYITLTPSGSAGSQVLTAAYSGTAPVWSTTKQGWYATAASIVRYVGGVYKGGGASYCQAFLLDGRQQQSSVNVRESVVIDIGAWDMTATASSLIATGIDPTKVLAYTVTLVGDDLSTRFTLPVGDGNATSVGSVMQAWSTMLASDGVLRLYRLDNGVFDLSAFNDPTKNRGWAIFWLGEDHNSG